MLDLPHYPSTKKNREFIHSIIKLYLPERGNIIETASGTGEHIVYFAEKFSSLNWQPTDRSDEMFWAIKKRSYSLKNISDPKIIDLCAPNNINTEQNFDAILNINMIHISRWKACIGLFSLAKKTIKDDGFVYLYGPYKKNNSHISLSNEEFDKQLRLKNSSWGVRSIEEVMRVSKKFGFLLYKTHEMPSNNFSHIFYKSKRS